MIPISNPTPGSEDEDDDVTLQEISLDSALDLGDGEEGYNQQQTKCLEDKGRLVFGFN